MTPKHRLDLELVDRGLAASRKQAQQLIRAGKVRDGSGTVLDKPGHEVKQTLELSVKQPLRFVSRGGEKLLAGLQAFPISVNNRVCLDGGISTGGFTDCLLQHGAARVYGVDVGYGQTAWSLRTDNRVVLREKTNLRYLQPEGLYGERDPIPTLAVTDVSFISLRLILPAIRRLLQSRDAEAFVLVKPQFEVGRNHVNHGGVVRDPNAHVDALESVIAAAALIDWYPQGIVASPITGPAGNHEYILWLGANSKVIYPDLKALVDITLR
ncbi:TlyA family RNA methyltransferase [Synechococcus sp. M16CYN]|uniref:TlyA family RNA methyltransferase n=1 Tax=Synechococcus sp. M16CYN TaxID=3103139 RepID=UPI003254580E